jgi:hypothetical protein
MKVFKNIRIVGFPFSFFQEGPTSIRVYPCPACNETISADADNCRFCHLPIDAATAERLVLENQRVTNAIASAITYRLSVLFAVLTLLVEIFDVLIKKRTLGIFVPLVGIGYGGLWLYRYRSLITKDVDYSVAVRKVKLTIFVWVVALVLPVVNVAAYGFGTPKTGVDIQGTNPPVFAVHGPGHVMDFSVGIFSPALPEDSPNRVQRIWEIIPTDGFNTTIESVQITYGTVPQGFTQFIPANGPPLSLPSLQPGQYYVFYLYRFNAPHSMGAFEMKDGKLSRVYGLPFCDGVDEKLKKKWMRCFGDEDPAK